MKIKTTIKNYFLSPLFAPIFGLLTCSIFINMIYIFLPHSVPQITKDGELVDFFTHIFYGLSILTFLIFFKDFKDKKIDYFSYISLVVCALLREEGAQKWLTSTDTTAIKIKFFTNPNNPLIEKIIAGFVIILVLTIVIYLIKKYFVYLVRGVFKMDTISWSFGTLVFFSLFAKFIDRFPSNFRKMNGEPLPQSIIDNLSVLEECSEIFMPLMVVLILFQYHLICKNKKINNFIFY